MTTKPIHSSLFWTAALLVASGACGQPVSSKSAPLALLRLTEPTEAGDAAKLASTKFAIDPLTAVGVPGLSTARKDNADYLALDAGKEFTRSLRGSVREVTFVSFQIYGSQTTIIEIGGARLGLTSSPLQNGLQLMYDDSTNGTLQWKSLNVHVPTARYAGKPLAALHPITIRLDPAAGVWDLFSGSRLLADSLPLIASRRDNRDFTLKAGTDGGWLVGLVLSDENPLYEDANANGIDDAFERQKRAGLLLPATATPTERHQLASDWKVAQHAKPPPSLVVSRPLPDRPVAGK